MDGPLDGMDDKQAVRWMREQMVKCVMGRWVDW